MFHLYWKVALDSINHKSVPEWKPPLLHNMLRIALDIRLHLYTVDINSFLYKSCYSEVNLINLNVYIQRFLLLALASNYTTDSVCNTFINYSHFHTIIYLVYEVIKNI
jgi:hypothetical protein